MAATRATHHHRRTCRGLGPASAGAAIGLAAAIGITQLLARAIGSLGAINVTSMIAATVVVMSIVIAASVVPAWRGSRIDPLAALRRH